MIKIIQQRLNTYNAVSAIEEEQASKEIIQEIALYALWRAGFFEVAAFQGGTSLRILHNLPRFSEDLDFILKDPDPAFVWDGYLKKLISCFEEYGLRSEALPKGQITKRIRRAVIKDNSIINQLKLSFYQGREDQKINIKLEIDIEPPAESGYGYTYLDFPTDFEVCHQDLQSNFALKIHALLCRGFVKGRDWYDFNWYIKQRIAPNLPHLRSALLQFGPWQGQLKLEVDLPWLRAELRKKIETIDWKAAARDVEVFLRPAELKSLSLWSTRFFSKKLSQMA